MATRGSRDFLGCEKMIETSSKRDILRKISAQYCKTIEAKQKKLEVQAKVAPQKFSIV